MKKITLLAALLVGSFGFAQQFADSAGPIPAEYAQRASTQSSQALNNTNNAMRIGSSTAYGVENVGGNYGNFDIAAPNTFNNVAPTPVTVNFEGAGAIDPDDNGTAYVVDNLGEAYSVDIATGVYTALGNLGLNDITGMEFDQATGDLYAITSIELYSVDLGSLSATLVGTTGMNIAVALAIDGSGVGYANDVVDDNMYSIDLSTGAATVLGPLGYDANFGQGMFWDENTDTVYLSAFNNGSFESELRTLDTGTGATTLVGGILPGTLAQVAWSSMPNSPPIDNDDCANADEIECGETLLGDTSNNTDQGGANTSPDEWFFWQSSGAPQFVTVSLCTGTAYDSVLSVYDACGGNQIAFNDDSCGLQSELTFISDGSTTYYIAVEGFGSNSGAFELTVTCVDPPVNDICSGALPIECGVPVFGNTDTATPDTSPDCTGPGTTTGIWYVYDDTTNLLTDININTCSTNTNYDTQISVYTGDCGTLTCVTGNDDSPNCTNFQSEVDFQSDGNTTFYILVHGFGAATGDFELNMTCVPVPPPNDMIVNSIDVDEIGVPYTDPSVAMPAATLEDGNPTGCVIDGANGVWYNFTAAANGTATAEIVSPAGASYVVFFKAPDENATETDLEYFFQIGNQCAPGTSADITTEAGQAYYVFVVNTDGVTDIVIDGELLSTVENTIEGFDFYPNPADETLTLTSVDTIERVSIYNLLGQEVLGQQVDGTNTQMNVSSLATGAYIMKVTVNGEVGTYKIIKR